MVLSGSVVYKLFHYSIAALRIYKRNKVGYGLIFIGLAFAFALNLITGSILWNAYSSDSHWKNSDRIYRITLRDESLETPFLQNISAGLVEDIRNFSSDIKQVVSTGIDFGDRIHEGKRYEVFGTAVDRNFLEIFDLTEVSGDLAATLSTPNTVALSEKKALEFYGQKNPVGETFELHGQNDGPTEVFTVGAIYKNPPTNSVWFDHEFLILRNPKHEFRTFKTAYILVKEGVEIDAILQRIVAVANQKYPKPEGASDTFYKVEALEGLQANFLSGKYANTQFISLLIASLFMLFVAVSNYILVSIAMSSQRRRDITLRKVMGARWQTVSWQYLIEALILVSASYWFALVLAEILSVPITNYTGQVYSTDVVDTYEQVLLGWFLALFIGGVVSIYPISIFVKGKTAKLLRSVQYGVTGGSTKLYTMLISLQAMCSLGIGLAAVIVYLQSAYQEELDKGIDIDNLLYVTVDIRSHPNYPSTRPMRNEITNLSGVLRAGNNSYSLPFRNILSERKYRASVTGKTYTVRYTSYGESFFDSLGVRVLAGQLPRHPEDTGKTNITAHGSNVVVNETMVQALGFESPEKALGACVFDLSDRTSQQGVCKKIRGVVADFHFDIGKNPIEPTVYAPVTGYVNTMIIRFSETANIEGLLPQIKEIWDRHFPERVFEYIFVDNLVHDRFQALRSTGVMFLITGGAIIFLTVAGLYSMARFIVLNRRREIAIHRVVGASHIAVIKLVLSQLIKPILMGALIGIPIGWYYSINWLEGYTVRINPEPWHALAFGIAGIVIFLIAVIAELIHAIHIRPADALSYD
jgi:putative ABC transport system permease protein